MTASVDLEKAVRRQRRRQWGFILGGLVLLVLTALASTSLGVDTIGLGKTLRILLSPLLPEGWSADLPPMQVMVVEKLRLPRTVMAIIGGAGLSAAGIAMQGITRNPLVSPFTLGISPAAAFGASLAIFLGLAAVPGLGSTWTVGCAFVAAMLCAVLVLALASLRGVSAIMLILAGVGLSYLFGALTATLQFIATEQQLVAIIHWTFGSLNGSDWHEVAVVGAVFLVAFPILLGHGWALNAFASGGDEVAASLGFVVGRTRLLVTVAAVSITAAIVSFTGVIGFVGLVAPHIARLLIGGDHRKLLPFGAIFGALLLLLADMIGRLAFAPVIIPVSIVVAYLGVPLLLHLILARRREFLG